jgi:uncharacterized protein
MTAKWLAFVPCFLFLAPHGIAQNTPPAKVFGGARMDEIYRIRLDRDDLLLESIMAAIKKYNIQDGAVLTGVGSLQECTYHWVSSLEAVPVDKFTTIKGPTELLGIDGIIANGEPHLHMTMSQPEKGAFGGHIENGCKVLYRLELTIAKFSGTPLARKPNREGTPLLQPK